MAIDDELNATIKVSVDEQMLAETINKIENLFSGLKNRLKDQSESYFSNLKENIRNFEEASQNFMKEEKNEKGDITKSEGGENKNNTNYIARNEEKRQLKEKENFEIRKANNLRQNSLFYLKGIYQSSGQMARSFLSLASLSLGVNALLNLTHDTNRMRLYFNAINANPIQSLALSNMIRRTGVNNEEFYTALSNVNRDLTQIQSDGTIAKAGADKLFAYSSIKQFAPKTLQTTWQQNPRRTDQQFQDLLIGYQRLVKENPYNLPKNVLLQIGQNAFGLNNPVAIEGLLESRGKPTQQDYKLAKEQVDQYETLRKLDANKTQLFITLETKMIDFIGKISPTAINFFDGMINFLNKNGEMVIAGGAFLTFIKTFGIFRGVLSSFLSPLKGAIAGFGELGEGLIAIGTPISALLRLSGLLTAAWVGYEGYKYYENKKENPIIKNEDLSPEQRQFIKNKGGYFSVNNGQVSYNKNLGAFDSIKVPFKENETIDQLQAEILKQSQENVKRRQAEGREFLSKTSKYIKDGTTWLLGLFANKTDVKIGDFNNPEVRKNLDTIYKILTTNDENGVFSPNQAEGILGSLYDESVLNPNAIGDNGKAYGIAQWHPDRQAKFLQYMGKPIQNSSVEEQTKFLKHELKNDYKGTYRSLHKTENRETAGYITRFNYEGPSDTARNSEKSAKTAEIVHQALMQENMNPTDRPHSPVIVNSGAAHHQQSVVIHNNVKIDAGNKDPKTLQKQVSDALYPPHRYFNGMEGMQ